MSCSRVQAGRKVLSATMVGSIIAAGLTLTLPAATAATPDGAATADTYTVSTRVDYNNGSNSKIAVGDNTGAERIGYLRLNASKSVEASDTMTLKMNITGGTAGELRILQGSASWQETSLAYANAPQAGKLLKTVKVAGGGQALTVKFTGAVSENDAVNLVLERADGGITRISSRESSKAPAATFDRAGDPTVDEPPVKEESQPDASNCSVSAILVPSCGIWFGAAANPLGSESWDQALVNFEKTADRDMDIAHYYKRGQSAMFPNSTELKRQNESGNERILFYNWKPTGLTWRQVADGAADGYLKKLAQHMDQNAQKKFFLSLNAEMEDEVNESAGSGQTAKDFADFFSHTVKVLRANGADNMVTVMNYTGIQKWGEKSWFDDLYPGDDVVDWIAQDPYAFGKPPVWLTDMEGMVNRTSNEASWPGFYNWAASEHPSKPQMLGEWGVDEDPAYPSYKADFWKTAADQLEDLPKIKALVYWDSTGVTPNGEALSVGDTRVDSKSTSLSAFRNFLNDDYVNVARESYFGN
ncbi:CBM96 family carbohydrate-binding protein [Glutamicibacter mysorens]